MLVAGTAALLLDTDSALLLVAGKAALLLDTDSATLLVAGKAALLLDTDSALFESTGMGMMKMVEAAEAVTVVGALVSPTIMTEGKGVLLA